MTEQLSLLDAATRRRARRTDPATSKQAAMRAGTFAQSHADRIAAALKQHGPLTAHELEPFVGLNYVQIDRRMAELRRDKRVQAYANTDATPLTRPTPTGGRATVWEAT